MAPPTTLAAAEPKASPTGLKGKAAPPLIQGTDRHFRKRGVGVPLQDESGVVDIAGAFGKQGVDTAGCSIG